MRLIPAGDTAILVQFENEISPENNSRVQSLAAMISDVAVPGVIETIPTYSSLLVNYDPTVVTFAELSQTLNSLTYGGVRSSGSFVYTVPVCYGGEYGEDLGDVASHASLSVEETIERHSRVCYRIYMLGFLPGFALSWRSGRNDLLSAFVISAKKYCTGKCWDRRKSNRSLSCRIPGGWRLIGKTPLKLYDPERAEPILYRAGDLYKIRADNVSAVCRDFLTQYPAALMKLKREVLK